MHGFKNVPKWMHKTSRAGGACIHWVEVGQPTNLPAVVLLHGLNDSHLAWKSVAAELARDRLVVIPDLPGHGLSGRPDADYTLRWYATIMSQWMVTAELDHADLVGHSLGGGIAQVMLLECRQRIRRLALVSPGGLGREIAIVLRLASIPFVIERFGQPFMPLGTRLTFKRSRGRPAEEVTALSSMNSQKGSAMVFSRTVRDIIDWRGQRHTYHKRIREVQELPPIHIFWGERDRVIPATHGKLMAEAFEGVGLTVFKNGGHSVHSESPELFTPRLLHFLDEPLLPAARLRMKTG